jgi:hypothetical protein
MKTVEDYTKKERRRDMFLDIRYTIMCILAYPILLVASWVSIFIAWNRRRKL